MDVGSATASLTGDRSWTGPDGAGPRTAPERTSFEATERFLRGRGHQRRPPERRRRRID